MLLQLMNSRAVIVINVSIKKRCDIHIDVSIKKSCDIHIDTEIWILILINIESRKNCCFLSVGRF